MAVFALAIFDLDDLLTFRFFSSRACRSSSSCVSSRASKRLRSCFRRAAIRSLIWGVGQQQQQQQLQEQQQQQQLQEQQQQQEEAASGTTS
jgi:hypothetical protein